MTENLKSWLSGIGLGSHAESFAANGVDWDVLLELTEADLRELGLSLGDRKRLLKAVGGLRDAAPAGDGARPMPTAAVPIVPHPASAPSATSASKPDIRLAAERRQVTVMFIDLVGSTSLSEQLDPEDMTEILRAFHEVCSAAVEAEDGYIAQYLGDGVLVYFGYPRAHEDDAARAVQAGLAIIDAMQSTNQALAERYGVRVKVRIGIHTGLVVVGDIGAGSARTREAIVGETPNVAARLQGEADPDTVVVSAATRRLSEGLFSFADAGSRVLRGLSAPIRVFRVVGPANTLDRFTARVGRGLTPLVGRSAELDMLQQRWEQVRDGEMRCILLVGEPGIGKSRVVHAFRERLADDPHQIISWHCSSYHSTSAFFPVTTWLCHSLGIDPLSDPALGATKLVSVVEGLEIEDPEAPVALASLLGLTSGDVATQDTSALAYRRRILDALTAILRAMAQRQALLVVVEDAHWSDPSTLDLLREVQDRLASTRLLLLVTSRPELRPNWNYSQFVQVNLDRLSRRERKKMIEQLTYGKSLPEFVLDQIVARTDGVPLFVEELTKTVLEEDVWRDAGTHYELKGPFQGIAIPDSLQGSLLARLDRLDPTAKQIAQIGSVIGREFGRDILRIVARLEDGVLNGSLDQLIAAEILRPVWQPANGGDAFSFRHALIQDSAYQSLLLAQRRQYHGAIAQALIDHFPDISAAQPELVAQHLTSGDKVELALGAWQRAANGAMNRGAYAEAKSHVLQGLALIERFPATEDVRSRHAVPFLLMRGRLEIKETSSKAEATLYQAATLARKAGLVGEFAEAAIGVCMAHQFGFAPMKAAKGLLQEALDHPAINDPILRCLLLSWMGRAAFLTDGDVAACSVRLTEARVLHNEHGDKRCLQDILGTELLICDTPTAAEFDDRRRMIWQYFELSSQEFGPFMAMYSIPLSAGRFLEIGEFEGFQAGAERLAELARITQAPGDRWLSSSFEAMKALLAGDYGAAEDAASLAVSAVNDGDSGPYLGVYGMQMFAIRREQGRLAEVAPLVKRFVMENPEESVWKPGLMLIANDLGFEQQARQHFRAFAETAFELPRDAKRPITLTYFAEVCAALGDAAAAERLLELLHPYRDVAMMVPPHILCCGSTRHYLGMLATTVKDWSMAEKHFGEALAFNERLKAWPRLAWTRFEYARMLLARGGRDDVVQAGELRKLVVDAAGKMGMGLLLQRNARIDVPN